MSYIFNPMTDEEIDLSSLLKAGNYDFQVLKSTKKVSKSGNNMAELLVKVFDKEGKEHTIFDYLVFSNVPLNIKKIKNFCESVGLQEEYKKGLLPEELSNYCGELEIGIKEEQRDENGRVYPRKNYVVNYIKAAPDSKNLPTDTSFNDELPF